MVTSPLPPLSRPLDDQLGATASELLRRLDQADIDCWLDSGSLLGLMRDGELPVWDKDIDLGVWSEDARRVGRIALQVARDTGMAYVEKDLGGRPYAYLLKVAVASSPRPLPVAIHVFEREGGFARSPQPHFLLARRAAYAKHELGARARRGKARSRRSAVRRAVQHRRYLACVVVGTLRLGRLVSAIVWVGDRFHSNGTKVTVHPAERAGTRWCYELFCWEVPVQHFESLIRVASDGWTLRIPGQTSTYLELRYGPTWRVAQRSWFYVLDDGALRRG